MSDYYFLLIRENNVQRIETHSLSYKREKRYRKKTREIFYLYELI